MSFATAALINILYSCFWPVCGTYRSLNGIHVQAELAQQGVYITTHLVMVMVSLNPHFPAKEGLTGKFLNQI